MPQGQSGRSFAPSYTEEFKQSIENKEAYWEEQAKKIAWFSPPKKILTKNDQGLYRWYEDGVLNTSYLALDHHVEAGRGSEKALIYDSPVTGAREHYTFRDLKTKVAELAGGLAAAGLRKGDRVIIYMPMIPEAVMSMLACARLGAIHSVVFGGFAPHELVVRVNHAKPKFILMASCGIEVARVIDYMDIVRTALAKAEHQVEAVFVKQREQLPANLNGPREKDFRTLSEYGKEAACVEVLASDPLYILYTSGTTGKPKGVLRDNGGHAVALQYSMDAVYKTYPGEVFWGASDIGWVVGHSYIVYGPLIQGCTTIVYEGKPVKTPDASAFYRVIAEYGVKSFFTAPTAFRAIKKEDAEGVFARKYDLSRLQTVFSAGERLDPPTHEWLQKIFVKQTIVDNWWQTEIGWPMVANPIGIEVQPAKIGSATVPIPGFDVAIMSDEGTVCPRGTSGNIVVRLPMPPGCLLTLWENDDLFKQVYLSFVEGVYLSGDGGYIDKDGFVFIMGRLDDVINVAGHRLSTGEMEEIVGAHPAVAECAVIGVHDEIKGQIPLGLAVLKDGEAILEAELEAELVLRVRETIGPVAVCKQILLIKRLPKTRSGKILRKTLRQLWDGETDIQVPSTIDDPSTLDELREDFAKRKANKNST